MYNSVVRNSTRRSHAPLLLSHVGIIRERGLLLSIEFVADKASKTPFEASLDIRSKFSHACLDRGLYIYQGSGNIDGKRGDHALLAPPFVIDSRHVDFIVDTMKDALDAVTQDAVTQDAITQDLPKQALTA
jgi:adenosylmethionine-8-amino-7-oxononanoate aminotransferase